MFQNEISVFEEPASINVSKWPLTIWFGMSRALAMWFGMSKASDASLILPSFG